MMWWSEVSASTIKIGAEDDVVERGECLHDQIDDEDDVVERGECLHDQIGAEDDVVERGERLHDQIQGGWHVRPRPYHLYPFF